MRLRSFQVSERGRLTGKYNRMLCGTAFKNKGVQRMLDAVIQFLPGPIDVPAVEGLERGDTPAKRKASDGEKFSA